MVPIAETETMQKDSADCRTDRIQIIVLSHDVYEEETPCYHYSRFNKVVCLYMAFLLWFHEPVLFFVATSHI